MQTKYKLVMITHLYLKAEFILNLMMFPILQQIIQHFIILVMGKHFMLVQKLYYVRHIVVIVKVQIALNWHQQTLLVYVTRNYYQIILLILSPQLITMLMMEIKKKLVCGLQLTLLQLMKKFLLIVMRG